MAETPVFESEKQFKKQRKRRILIAVIAAVLVAAAAVAVGLLNKSCAARTHTGGEDLPFPYTWRQLSDGSAVLSVTTGGEGLSWRISDPGEEYGTVGMIDEGVRNGESRFKLTPMSEGRAISTITLSPEGGDKGAYVMELLTEAYKEGSRLRCRVLNATCKLTQQAIEVTEGPFAYRIFKDEDGDMIMEVPGSAEDWECVSSDEETAAILGVVYDEGAVRAYLRAGSKPGESEVVLTSAADGKELKAVFTLNEAEEFTVSRYEATASEPAATQSAEDLSSLIQQTQQP